MTTSTMPIAVPIQFSGQVICQNACQGLAPHTLATSSSWKSKFSSDR